MNKVSGELIPFMSFFTFFRTKKTKKTGEEASLPTSPV
jgi:hypothetical protein